MRLLTFFLTLVLSLTLVPALEPGGGGAAAQTLANGFTLVGDFRGNGTQQIASIYDPNDDFGLRIVVLDRGADGKFTHTEWFLEGANHFDVSRMKPVAVDLNGDKKTDIAVLYNDGGHQLRVHRERRMVAAHQLRLEPRAGSARRCLGRNAEDRAAHPVPAR